MTEPLDPTVGSGRPSTLDGDGDEAYCAACNQSFSLDHEFCPNDGAKLTKLTARPDPLLGRVFDQRYEIRSALGHGGMGTVYRGWQLSVDREVAIKVIHPKLASDRIAVKRFLREARLSSRLNQPNIINVYDFGQTDDGILYLVMELLRGRTLVRELEQWRSLAIRRVVAIGLQLCDALESAHNQGIIHRDLKPGNIVILDEPPGRDLVKVLDFGLAKSLASDAMSSVTHSSAMLGTPLYMPPEQVEGGETDPRSDLYSLGCILYQMVSGRPPFVREHVGAVLQAHVRDPVPALAAKTPEGVASLIMQLVEKDPARRPASAAKVRTALEALGDPGDVAVASIAPVEVPIHQRETIMRADARAPIAIPPRSRRGVAIGLAIVAAAAIATVVLVLARPGHDASDGAVPAAVPPIAPDAASPDAAVADAAPDATPDAAIAAPRPVVPPPPRRAPPHHPPPDAGSELPDLHFVPGDAR